MEKPQEGPTQAQIDQFEANAAMLAKAERAYDRFKQKMGKNFKSVLVCVPLTGVNHDQIAVENSIVLSNLDKESGEALICHYADVIKSQRQLDAKRNRPKYPH